MDEKEYSLDDVYFSLSDTQEFNGTKDPEELMKKSVISDGFLAKKKLPAVMYNSKIKSNKVGCFETFIFFFRKYLQI